MAPLPRSSLRQIHARGLLAVFGPYLGRIAGRALCDKRSLYALPGDEAERCEREREDEREAAREFEEVEEVPHGRD